MTDTPAYSNGQLEQQLVDHWTDGHTAGRIAELDHLLDLVPTFTGFGATLQTVLERRRAELLEDQSTPGTPPTDTTIE